MMDELHNTLQLAEHTCRQKNSRLTPKRRDVLTILLLADKAISAYELMDLFKIHFNKDLLTMTTYRTLEFLESMQLAHKLSIANKYIACAHIGCELPHELPHFLVCQQCLRVDELNNEIPNNLNNITSKAEQTGYQLFSPQIELNCICNSCLATEN